MKALEMTERVTIRYYSIDNMVGLGYYFNLLGRLLDTRVGLVKDNENIGMVMSNNDENK